MKKIALLIPVILTLFSCDKNDDRLNETETNVLKFEVGQKMRYILLEGDGYDYEDGSDYFYTGDTLELEVLNVDNNKYLISEKITQFSNIHFNGGDYYRQQDSIYLNYWTIRNDSITFEMTNNIFRSHLINKAEYEPHKPDLSLIEFENEEVQITGWKTSYPYREQNVELYTTNYTLLGTNYDRLNVYINNLYMGNDGPGYTTVYSNEYGIVRTSIYGWWNGRGRGWDRINYVQQ